MPNSLLSLVLVGWQTEIRGGAIHQLPLPRFLRTNRSVVDWCRSIVKFCM
ncbi:hypothetical protein [Chamaesiphon sp. VAR_48_metabat_403]|nr:hypothetical protein [Chamaesiphon sp. VAR_48_metabat_403]